MTAQEEIKSAAKAYAKQLLNDPAHKGNVSSVGYRTTDDGKGEIRISLVEPAAKGATFPEFLDGIPVIVEVTGIRFVALGGEA